MRQPWRFYPFGILLAGCGLLWNAHSQDAVPIAGALSSVMSEMPGLQVVDQVISAQEQRVAGMTDYVARAYRRDSLVAFTTFVSYYDRQTQGKTIHSPRNCLPGAGWEVVSGGAHTVVANGQPRTVNRYVLRNGNATAIAYYWYQGRGRVTANEYRVKWNLLRDAALYGRTEEALVRVVVPVRTRAVAGENAEAALRAADLQASEVTARLMTDVQRVLPSIS
jgi:EpsI family protein